jgi:hypothetical protein
LYYLLLSEFFSAFRFLALSRSIYLWFPRAICNILFIILCYDILNCKLIFIQIVKIIAIQILFLLLIFNFFLFLLFVSKGLLSKPKLPTSTSYSVLSLVLLTEFILFNDLFFPKLVWILILFIDCIIYIFLFYLVP